MPRSEAVSDLPHVLLLRDIGKNLKAYLAQTMTCDGNGTDRGGRTRRLGKPGLDPNQKPKKCTPQSEGGGCFLRLRYPRRMKISYHIINKKKHKK